AIADQTLSYTVAGVGTTTVQVRGGVLSLVSAVPAAGWTLDEAGMDGLEAESEYVQGSVEVDVDIQIDDGLLRVR
ncbi:MAG: hypothetical protein GWN79_17980, partial [Actinobacteria bacterium]|nr:hypothetical protein [Actinomycetota bacterium]NIS33950.1 hypothetical protein [Actinomycetota bacterium]NIT97172.1 hypothetical protein [Actinomycetota bacterium]NIU20844.1 hypothetical protein [Actinomycetota bacterium]NIU68754.1 hypothetical protein [Actinomycetota bacterium]